MATTWETNFKDSNQTQDKPRLTLPENTGGKGTYMARTIKK